MSDSLSGKKAKRQYAYVGTDKKTGLKCMASEGIAELFIAVGWLGERRPQRATNQELGRLPAIW